MSKYKYDIIHLLVKNQSQFISGQKIASLLNISRTSVWKSIEQLKEEGFMITSVSNKGHQLKSWPKNWDKHLIKLVLSSQHYFKHFEVRDEVDSTQKLAQSLLHQLDEPFIVISEHQSKGRGRFNRNWESKVNEGIWMSLVFKDQIPFEKIQTFNLFISLAIAKTIQKFVDADAVKIKWPNDIYIQDKKVCGFLTEINGNIDEVSGIICGIGINVNQTTFNDEIKDKATSIHLAADNIIDRYQLLEMLINNILKYYQLFLSVPFSDIKSEYQLYSNVWQRTLKYTQGNKIIHGKAINIEDDGQLVVIDEKGQLHKMISADIEM
ncbi:biotin--[acetyl-CoA-carboxylase] ligase [Macrococcus sp. DPC7161]|uniref:biotin--[acetyl-CoA-carboxylase] ligase n=1 Tax=Macrococcus sp. DPC7161 TaxID=2507060 RepID=UPI00100B1978|nr:biotin--[acetyl-CoA-carboxylase] ligase [Macrococcus sp. DPC7161]RXK19263.1 biotin--[acetyl-CoA-carboxylase] ligase [Macrococcus sp. DPC7161]